jgi:hypothetical protein
MTDDIVTRLREEPCGETWCDQCKIYGDAADEIERLGELLFQEIYRGQEKLDEIERLRADRKELLQIAKLFADEGVCRMYEERWGCCTHSPCDWHDAEHMWESFCMARGI